MKKFRGFLEDLRAAGELIDVKRTVDILRCSV